MAVGNASVQILGVLDSLEEKVNDEGQTYWTGSVRRVTTSQGKMYENTFQFYLNKGGSRLQKSIGKNVLLDGGLQSKPRQTKEGEVFHSLTLRVNSIEPYGSTEPYDDGYQQKKPHGKPAPQQKSRHQQPPMRPQKSEAGPDYSDDDIPF